MNTVGLGVLSWRGAHSLRATLQSYQERDFFSLFDQPLLFLPDPDEAVLGVAGQFTIPMQQDPVNRGILAGMEQIALRLQTDYILFAENDCPLIETKSQAKSQLNTALSLLSSGQAQIARMRHIKNPGQPFVALEKYRQYYPQTDTWMAKAKRWMRPSKARRLQGIAIYQESDPAGKFPKVISKADNGFYLVDASVLNWSNLAVLVEREFFLKTIIAYAKNVPFTRGANNFPALEIELNHSKFWKNSDWKIACGPGILTHQRLEDRGY